MQSARDPLLRRTPAALASSLLLAAALLLPATAAAQDGPLSHLLPEATIAVIDYVPGGGDFGILQEVLDDLDVAGVWSIVASLTGEPAAAPAPVPTLTGLFEAALSGAADELAADCPQAADLLDLEAVTGPVTLGVSLSAARPLPGVVALLRPADAGTAGSLIDALAACLPGGGDLQEADVTLHLLGDGPDGPVVLARLDGLVIATGDPDLARAVVRLARGSSEPSFRASALGASLAGSSRPGIGFILDLAALADLAGNSPDLEADPLVERLTASLKTLGGFSAHAAFTARGLTIQSSLATNPTGGDPTLARLITCADCVAPGPPPQLPTGGVMLSAGTLPVVDLVGWIDDWLASAASLTGDSSSLRELSSEYLGLDLDAGLLDWWDGTWYAVQLDLPGSDVRGWLQGASGVTALPVTSEAAAVAAIEVWGAGLKNLAGALPGGLWQALLGAPAFGGLDADSAGAADAPLFATMPVTHRGVTYQRWRAPLAIDLGVMVADGHMLIASPSSLMRQVIDQRSGAAPTADDAQLRAAIAALPAGTTSYSVADVPRVLRHFASLLDLVATPAASAVALSLDEMAADLVGLGDDSFGDFDFDSDFGGFESDGGPTGMGGYPADYLGPDPRASDAPTLVLSVPSSSEHEITFDTSLADSSLGLVLELSGLSAGDLVEIEVLDPSSYEVDPLLFLFDMTNGRIVAANDDAPGVERSAVIFEVMAGIDYAAVVTSWMGDATGTVIVNASVLSNGADGIEEPGEAPADEGSAGDSAAQPRTPTFEEVLRLFDFVTGFLDGLADRSGVGVWTVTVEDNVVRSTLVVPAR